MLDLSNTPDGFLDPIARVMEAALEQTDGLSPDDVMVVGAWCRDILHHALGHNFATTATRDLDLALALSSWDAYSTLAATFPRVGDTGIRFRIANTDVDLLPFGNIEDPQGIVAPPTRGESMSVWAFDEIFAASLPLALSPTITIRNPTVAGFAAAKLGAWLDRSEWHEAKDAPDLALIMHWYAESTAIHGHGRGFSEMVQRDLHRITGRLSRVLHHGSCVPRHQPDRRPRHSPPPSTKSTQPSERRPSPHPYAV